LLCVIQSEKDTQRYFAALGRRKSASQPPSPPQSPTAASAPAPSRFSRRGSSEGLDADDDDEKFSIVTEFVKDVRITLTGGVGGSQLVRRRCASKLFETAQDADQPPSHRRIASELLTVLGLPVSPASTIFKPLRDDTPLRPIHILCLDGGGVRGIASIAMLDEILNACGFQYAQETFDLICGTSTGGIIAVCMGVMSRDCDETHGMYKECAGEIFRNSWGSFAKALGKGPGAMAAATFEKVMGNKMATIVSTDLRDDPSIATSPHLAIPRLCLVSTLASRNPCTAYLFRNYLHRPTQTLEDDFSENIYGEHRASLLQGLRATSAAPFYLKEHKHWKSLSSGTIFPSDPEDVIEKTKLNFVDGCFVANNPTPVAVREARQLWGQRRGLVIVSISTGEGVPAQMKRGGAPRWVQNLVNASGNASLTDVTLRAMLSPHDKYVRLNPCGEVFGCDMGDANPRVCEALWDKAKEYMASPKIRTLVAGLKDVLSPRDGPPCWCLNTETEHIVCRRTRDRQLGVSHSASDLDGDVVSPPSTQPPPE